MWETSQVTVGGIRVQHIFNAYFGSLAVVLSSVTFHIYAKTGTRGKALFIEKLLVTQHVNKWGYKPGKQDYPQPFDVDTWKKFLKWKQKF